MARRAYLNAALLNGVCHYAALEAPERLAEALLAFIDRIDQGGSPAEVTDGHVWSVGAES